MFLGWICAKRLLFWFGGGFVTFLSLCAACALTNLRTQNEKE